MTEAMGGRLEWWAASWSGLAEGESLGGRRDREGREKREKIGKKEKKRKKMRVFG